MIRPVGTAVAVPGGGPERLDRIGQARRGGMAPLHGARLARPGPPHLQEVVVEGAVGLVAVGAALAHGGVLEDEGPPLLGMAVVAVLVDGVALQELLGGRAVRGVAVGALRRPLPRGPVGVAEALGLPDEGALGAGVVLGG